MPESEMQREVTNDLKGVYYRGRYWAALAWSKVGASGSDRAVRTGTGGDAKSADKSRRKTGPKLEPAA